MKVLYFLLFSTLISIQFLTITGRVMASTQVSHSSTDIMLNGQIKDVENQIIYIWTTDFPRTIEADLLIDSTMIKDGYFRLNFKTNGEIQFYKLTLGHEKGKSFVFLASPGDQIYYDGSLENFRWGNLQGSRQDSLFRELYFAQAALINLNNRYLDSAQRATDTLLKKHYDKLRSSAFEEYINMNIQELIKRPDSYAGLMNFDVNIFREVGKDSSQNLFNGLNKQVKNTVLGRRAERLLNLSPGDESIIGKIFPWGDLKDSDGNQWKTAPKEKNTLVIMWASWCGPCLEEVPDLKKLHAELKDELTLISISLDTRENAWRDAMEKQNMPWLQLWTNKAFNSDIAYGTGIQSIPQLFLLDTDDRIIGEWQHLSEMKLK